MVGIVGLIFLSAIAAARLQRLPLSTPIAWSLISLATMATLQSVPLPHSIWRLIGAGANFQQQVDELGREYEALLEKNRPESEPAGSNTNPPSIPISAPQSISIYPLQTRASAAVFASAIAMLIASGVLFRDTRWMLALLSVLSITTLLNGLLGVFQSVAWNRWTLLEMQTDAYFSTFVSRNSAPQYYAIGIGATVGLLAWWTKRRGGDAADRRYHVRYPAVNAFARLRRRLEELVTDLDTLSVCNVFAVTFLFVAVLATTSRGGILACIGSTLILLVMSVANKGLGRSSVLLGTIAAVVLILLTSLELDDVILKRLGTISSEATSVANPRYRLWLAALSNPHDWLLGCGMGTFHFAVLPREGFQGSWAYHAENVYIEVLTEFGFVGLSIAVVGLAWLLRRLRVSGVTSKTRSGDPTRPAAIFAVAAIALQSFVDFSLIVPAVFLSLAALVGCFCLRCLPSGHSPKTEKGSPPSPWKDRLLVALVVAIMAQGVTPLLGFAAAEPIEWRMKYLGGYEANRDLLDRYLEAPRTETTPELSLQIARVRQAQAERLVLDSSRWPAELPTEIRAAFSEADKISAAFRGAPAGTLSELKDIASADESVLPALRRSAVEGAQAVSACPHDWRASWAIARGDCGQLSTTERAENYARLVLLTYHYPQLRQKLGTVAFWAGERSIGLDVWRRLIAATPGQAVQIAELVGTHVSLSELNQVLPKSPWIRIRVAQRLVANKNPLAQEFTESLDLAPLQWTANSLTQWKLLVWAASHSGSAEIEIRALTRIAELAPTDHQTRHRLARLLENADKLEDAIHWMEQAVRRSRSIPQYVEYLEHLKKKLQASSKVEKVGKTGLNGHTFDGPTVVDS